MVALDFGKLVFDKHEGKQADLLTDKKNMTNEPRQEINVD